jgi:rhodanese-related sulfurtransferase
MTRVGEGRGCLGAAHWPVWARRQQQQENLGGSSLIPLGALRSRLGELPKEKEIVTFCKVSLRGYEAAKILQGTGFKRVRVMDGGMAVWPFEKRHGQG